MVSRFGPHCRKCRHTQFLTELETGDTGKPKPHRIHPGQEAAVAPPPASEAAVIPKATSSVCSGAALAGAAVVLTPDQCCSVRPDSGDSESCPPSFQRSPSPGTLVQVSLWGNEGQRDLQKGHVSSPDVVQARLLPVPQMGKGKSREGGNLGRESGAR